SRLRARAGGRDSGLGALAVDAHLRAIGRVDAGYSDDRVLADQHRRRGGDHLRSRQGATQDGTRADSSRVAVMSRESHQALSGSSSSSARRAGSANTSMLAILSPARPSTKTARGTPPGAHTKPTAPETSAIFAACARPENVRATAAAPRSSGTNGGAPLER